ncbi:MAG TPA: helix-turn-helix transcriptional regulator [Verrucomicrobiae bacterium]|nr:helix-turn-helix transcriptional regulator [Verrucomicrobiae bacterium]
MANVVGGRLREVRIAAGLTQSQLSKLCLQRGLKLARGTLAKIECQVRMVKACELYIIARVLDVPVESFYPDGFGRPSK